MVRIINIQLHSSCLSLIVEQIIINIVIGSVIVTVKNNVENIDWLHMCRRSPQVSTNVLQIALQATRDFFAEVRFSVRGKFATLRITLNLR